MHNIAEANLEKLILLYLLIVETTGVYLHTRQFFLLPTPDKSAVPVGQGWEKWPGSGGLTALALHVAGHSFEAQLVQQTLLLGAQAQGLGE